MAPARTLHDFFDSEPLYILEARLELHGIFWFHTFAQPRDKYNHILVPVIHNYPLTLALQGLPSEAYTSISDKITFAYKPEDVWRDKGFYVYPAVPERMISKIQTFAMGGTGYVQLKPKTRASVPDFTANQVLFPGTVFKTYILSNRKISLPRVIRLGAKRYGVFKIASLKRLPVSEAGPQPVTHPFNVKDAPADRYHGVLSHYAGDIALTGIPSATLVVGRGEERRVLAMPRFIR